MSTVTRINTNGLAQIADALGQYHKLGRAHFTADMLGAWAADAEASADAGNGCQFEIRGPDSVTGAPVIVTIGTAGFDIEPADDCVTVTLINPFSGAQVEHDVSAIDPQVIANLMTDDELYACEGEGATDAEWVLFVAQHVGPERMGVLVLS